LRIPDGEVLVPIYSPIAVQGLGAGAITSSVQIMLSDLVTLRERGTFSGLMALCDSLSLFLETS
jgi:MFS family permease